MDSTLSGHTDHSEQNLTAPLFSFRYIFKNYQHIFVLKRLKLEIVNLLTLFSKVALLVFSFGQTAIFLLGGKTIEEEPLAIFLKSGDVVIMSEDSRLCYHGVPKILRSSDKSWNNINIADKVLDKYKTVEICTDDKFWLPYSNYLDNCRINMNVRQVLNKNQKSLDDK